MENVPEAGALRDILARLVSNQGADPGAVEDDGNAVLALAAVEGVAALLLHQWRDNPAVSDAVRDAWGVRQRQHVAWQLWQEAAIRGVLPILDSAGVRVLLLKGAAVGQWLYAEPWLRESSDIDLLFASRNDAEFAARLLEPLGFLVPYQPGRFAHELVCRNARKRLDLDLHWKLSRNPTLWGLPGFDDLYSRSQALPRLGVLARGLGAVDALLHACVHRASNLEIGLGDRLKWLYDIHLLARVTDEDAWLAFAGHCRVARMCGIAHDGLLAAQRLFGSPIPGEVVGALKSGMTLDTLDSRRLADWRYMQWRCVQALPDWRSRIAWLRESAFPPAGYMRELYGDDLSYRDLLWRRLGRAVGRVTGSAARPD